MGDGQVKCTPALLKKKNVCCLSKKNHHLSHPKYFSFNVVELCIYLGFAIKPLFFCFQLMRLWSVALAAHAREASTNRRHRWSPKPSTDQSKGPIPVIVYESARSSSGCQAIAEPPAPPQPMKPCDAGDQSLPWNTLKPPLVK